MANSAVAVMHRPRATVPLPADHCEVRPRSSGMRWAVSAVSETTRVALLCVASAMTGGATPASSASRHRPAHRHQRSPGFSPAKPPRGVSRSLPRAFVNRKNVEVTSLQTTCTPVSSGSVEQRPSRKKPVSGASEHAASGEPRMFLSEACPITICRGSAQELASDAVLRGSWSGDCGDAQHATRAKLGKSQVGFDTQVL